MKTDFRAIDFEIVQGRYWDICQLGLVRVEKGSIREEISLMVQPLNNSYRNSFIEFHGITPQKITQVPTFGLTCQSIKPFIKNQNLVAHNGFSFDFQCPDQALEYYGVTIPKYKGQDTCRIFSKNLSSLCKRYKLPLNQHDALACVELYKKFLNRKYDRTNFKMG